MQERRECIAGLIRGVMSYGFHARLLERQIIANALERPAERPVASICLNGSTLYSTLIEEFEKQPGHCTYILYYMLSAKNHLPYRLFCSPPAS